VPTYTFKSTQLANTGRAQGGVQATGTGNVVVALTDGTDATYDRAIGSSNPTDFLDYYPQLCQLNGERVVSVVPYCRSKSPGPSAASVKVGAAITPGGPLVEGVALSLPAGSSVVANYALAPQVGQFVDPLTGAEWSPYFGSDWLTISLRDANSAANAVYWYEAGLYVYTTKPATIAAPTIAQYNGGWVTTTQYPTFSALVSALVESWQLYAGGEFCTTGRVEFSVYRQADAGNGASPPAGVVPVMSQVVPFDLNAYIDGVTLSSLTVSLRAPAPLPDDSYVVYARVVRDHPTGQDVDPTGRSAWSSYQKLSWSQLVGGPYAPGCGMRADDAPQGMLVKITPSGPAAYTQTSSVAYVERLVGGVWRAVRGMSGVAVPVNVETTLGYDYECDRGAANTYRLRHTMVLTADGTLASSPWTQMSLAGPNPIGTGWNLKAVDLPGASWLSAGILTEPAESDQTQATIFYPLDRPCPVVVKGTAGGWAGSYDFIASGAAAVAALRALVDYEGLVFVETAFGDAFYCSLTGTTVKRQGTSPSPRLAGTLTFAQVDCDLVTES
jgi:hypothetical protein